MTRKYETEIGPIQWRIAQDVEGRPGNPPTSRQEVLLCALVERIEAGVDAVDKLREAIDKFRVAYVNGRKP